MPEQFNRFAPDVSASFGLHLLRLAKYHCRYVTSLAFSNINCVVVVKQTTLHTVHFMTQFTQLTKTFFTYEVLWFRSARN
jgi:hypothetical protein